jgi:glutamyl-tRNA reductase
MTVANRSLARGEKLASRFGAQVMRLADLPSRLHEFDAGVQNFMHWLGQRRTVPLIQQLNAQTDEWRAAEITRAKKLLARGESVDTVLEALSRGLTQKMLHGALAELHAGDADSREATAQTVSRLFLRGGLPSADKER